MKYFNFDFLYQVREISRKEFLRLMHSDRDYIEWYNDGKSAFIGDCTLDEDFVIDKIIEIAGVFDPDYCLAFG